MRKAWALVVATFLGCLLGWGQSVPAPEAHQVVAADPPNAPVPGDIPGKTQPAPGRSATIANVPLHPVEKVLVQFGDRVKKDQKLIELDKDERPRLVGKYVNGGNDFGTETLDWLKPLRKGK